MKEDCFGYSNGWCHILTEGWNCDKCKFYATRRQAEISRLKAAEMLECRGLRPVVAIDEDGKTIMTVEKIS